MKINEARQILDDFVGRLTSTLAFRRTKCLVYSRGVNEATAILSFPCRVDPRGFAAFTVGVGLRFESIARWLDDGPEEATFGTPIHFLREDKNFTEWKFSDSNDLERLFSAVLDDLSNLAIPFIERYSTLSELRGAVESSNPRDWVNLGLDVDRRVNVLAAIQLIQGDTAGAIEILDNALLERRTALPKRRFEIEYLRKRVVQAN